MTTTAALRTIQAVPAIVEMPTILRVHLTYRESLVLKRVTPGLQILADRCTLLVTQEGVLDDVLLRPGERFMVREGRRLVLQGMR